MGLSAPFGFESYTKSCLETHTGLWCVDDVWASQFLTYLQSGLLQSYLAQHGPIAPTQADDRAQGYDLYGDVAVVPLVGSLSPKGSKWGGGSTLEFRRGIRAASRNPDVNTILAYINSPGGVVEGTYEAARDLREAGTTKATHAHIQDIGASAAYWIGSQAQKLTANTPAFVGNIGVRSAIVDTSRLFELQGAKVHLFSTGPFKAIGVPGVEVQPEQIAHFQQLVDRTFDLFRADVASGRNLKDEALDRVLDGKTYLAADALSVGLIDEVSDMDALLPSGGSGMSEEHADMSKFQSFLSTFKLRVVPEEQKPSAESVQESFAFGASAGESVRPIKTYEDGVKDGIDAARKEAVAIMQLCQIAGETEGLKMACEFIKTGASPDDVREALFARRALRGEQDEEGQALPEINTGRVPSYDKPKARLRPVSEVIRERQAMAASWKS